MHCRIVVYFECVNRPLLLMRAFVPRQICVFQERCISFGEKVTDKLEIQTDGVLQETFDSTNIFFLSGSSQWPFILPVSHGLEINEKQW